MCLLDCLASVIVGDPEFGLQVSEEPKQNLSSLDQAQEDPWWVRVRVPGAPVSRWCPAQLPLLPLCWPGMVLGRGRSLW